MLQSWKVVPLVALSVRLTIELRSRQNVWSNGGGPGADALLVLKEAGRL
jgi:hypothetical protein